MNGLFVQQQGQSYYIFTPQGIQIGLLYMGNDGQFMTDAVAMKAITKILGKRWGINPNQGQQF